jgi:hypothetical protein
MKKLTHIATALANSTLSMRDMTLVKGGTNNPNGTQNNTQNGTQNPTANITQMMDDEKRRERPGGGITTN